MRGCELLLGAGHRYMKALLDMSSCSLQGISGL